MKPGDEIRRAQHVVEVEIARVVAEFNLQQGVVVDEVHIEYFNGQEARRATQNRPVVRLHVET